MPSDKERVKMLSNALKWEAYSKKAPKWFGRKQGVKRAQQAQKDIVKELRK